MPRLRSVVALVAFAAALPCDAQQAPACSAPQHREFDFWIGTWDVSDPSGKPVGRNRITSVHAGCVLLEQWEGRGGFSGTSVNAWDAAAGRWHQTWVDSAGSVLKLDGGYPGGRMRLEGDAPDRERPGTTARQRIDWEPQPDGRVRQHWQASRDAGATWTTLFDGWYRKAP